MWSQWWLVYTGFTVYIYIWWKFWNLMKFLSFEILYIFFNFQIWKLLNFKLLLENFDPLPMVYRPPYPWNIDPPTHGISTPLPMVFWPPYPWYFDPPIHGILTPLLMVYWPPYPWYIDPPTHGILTPLPMEYRTPYPWYFDPPGRKAKRMVLQCINGVGSNPVQGRTKIWQL